MHRLWGWDAALLWLAGASLVFYGQWSPALAGLLLGSILFNFGAARLLLARVDDRRIARRLLLAAIAANLALLGYFKYTNFLIDNVNLLTGSIAAASATSCCRSASRSTPSSRSAFWSRSTIARSARSRFRHYLLFASFFPCVTAGPIVLQRDMLPQLASARPAGLDSTRIAVALTVFGIGLFKKLILADSIAPFADGVFDGAAAGLPVAAVARLDRRACLHPAALLRLLRLLRHGARHRLPVRAQAAAELQLAAQGVQHHRLLAALAHDDDALLHQLSVRADRHAADAPRAAARYGRTPRFLLATALPVVATFVLAGLWHGAGWTFVVFGLIHGLALAVNHGWREARLPALPPARAAGC